MFLFIYCMCEIEAPLPVVREGEDKKEGIKGNGIREKAARRKGERSGNSGGEMGEM